MWQKLIICLQLSGTVGCCSELHLSPMSWLILFDTELVLLCTQTYWQYRVPQNAYYTHTCSRRNVKITVCCDKAEAGAKAN